MLNMCKLFTAAIVCSLAAAVNAAPILQINDTGILTGASGVLVNDALFDVQFRDGECGGLPHLCDFPSSFTFNTSERAEAASQALLAQVFLGVYDQDYKLTNGCQNMAAVRTGCAVLTPYETYLHPYVPYQILVVLASAAFNTHTNHLQSWLLLGDDSTRTIWDYATYAIWTPVSVPEPSPLALLAVGLAGMFFRKRRKHAQQSTR